MHRSGRWLPLGLVLILGLLMGLLGFSIWEKTPIPVERVVWSQQAQWIAPQVPTYRFYARHTFDLPTSVKAGWLRISADNDFTIYVNSRQIARENSVLNSPSGIGAGLRVPFQNINDSSRYGNKGSVCYLLGSSKDWKLTTYVDLTHNLRPGKNVIALEIQKGQTNPRVVIEGVVYPVANTTPVNLTTGETSWRISNLSETHHSLQWYDLDFPDTSWSEAKLLGFTKEATYSRLSKNLFDRNLEGNWITGIPSRKGEQWLRGAWQIPKTPIAHAYIRFAGEGQYSVLLNGHLVNRYRDEDGSKLHLMEVTKLLQPGNNFLAVSLASSLEAASGGSNLVSPNSSLDFLLDGWAETQKSEIVGVITTNNIWKTINQPVSGWVLGAGKSQSATLLSLPKEQEFQRNFEGDAYLLNYPNYLWHQSLWQLGGITFAVIYASLLSLWLGYKDSRWKNFATGAAILSPGTLFLIVIGLLKHRFAEAEVGLLFAQPQSNYLILLGFIAIVVSTLIFNIVKLNIKKLPLSFLWLLLGLVTCMSFSLAVRGNIFVVLSLAVVAAITAFIFGWLHRQKQLPILVLEDAFNTIQQKWAIWGEWAFIILIVGVGFGLRVYHLSFIDLDADENTSLDATRGILRIGVPIATSGIWYTRGPFYHYLLAFWLRLVGDSIVNARFLSVLWGTATLVLVYIFARQLTIKVWICLLVIAVLAIDPWEIWYSRFIRFYPVLQFMTILCFWSFLKGFIDREGRRYQFIFFIALTMSLLTQEVNLTLLPIFILGFLYFYRPFNLFHDWQIILGSIMMLIIFAFDLGFAVIKLLTPLPALSDATASYLRLHFSDTTGLLATYMIGPDRMRTIYSLLFIIGILYFIKLNQNSKIIFLFGSIYMNILLVTVLAYNLQERYIYGMYPIFILLSIYSGICMIESLGRIMQSLLHNFLPLKTIFVTCFVLVIICNLQPERVLSGYQEAINRKNTILFEYIRTHKKSGDVVLSTMPSFAPISIGKLDYFLFTPLKNENFDLAYWKDGKLIDRWGGGEIVNSVDKLNHILEKSNHVWIQIDDVRHNRVLPELRQYVQTLGKPIFETFGTRLRIWQPSDGLPNNIPNQGKDLGAY
ncbi:glycosyltransferase family 39 protein [Nostoc sp. NMS8]|uniref:phospholipid carrier-dependent glycosyltransferase n=1 Tax=Nostoc sp. NMS8 TaxID=2815392 RepID=UPI0025DA1346|nr:glycosyltransferase family 39 protein [Nostoc sp. NMS8]MBN3962486.1 glycosyltransferase family 39 protein [Nostoc sp. NMS8]